MRALAAAVLALAFAGCGDKVPQSEAAKKIGSAPKQAVDSASQRANDALKQGAERTRQGSD